MADETPGTVMAGDDPPGTAGPAPTRPVWGSGLQSRGRGDGRTPIPALEARRERIAAAIGAGHQRARAEEGGQVGG